jgi:hypothetical protein
MDSDLAIIGRRRVPLAFGGFTVRGASCLQYQQPRQQPVLVYVLLSFVRLQNAYF